MAAACIAAFDLLESEPERIDRLWANTRYFQEQLRSTGFNVGGVTTPATETPITPILLGDGPRDDGEFSRALFDRGLMATGIAFPTVPEGKARIRCIMTSEHTREQIDRSLEILTSTAKEKRPALGRPFLFLMQRTTVCDRPILKCPRRCAA